MKGKTERNALKVTLIQHVHVSHDPAHSEGSPEGCPPGATPQDRLTDESSNREEREKTDAGTSGQRERVKPGASEQKPSIMSEWQF